MWSACDMMSLWSSNFRTQNARSRLYQNGSSRTCLSEIASVNTKKHVCFETVHSILKRQKMILHTEILVQITPNPIFNELRPGKVRRWRCWRWWYQGSTHNVFSVISCNFESVTDFKRMVFSSHQRLLAGRQSRLWDNLRGLPQSQDWTSVWVSEKCS